MMSKLYSILSLDGGGIRGLVTALILKELEAKIQQRSPGKQLKYCFDLIAGTSTGSLIACALSSGLPISEIVGLYTLDSGKPQRIFPPTILSYFTGLINRWHLGISQPLYDGKGLEEVLQEVFGQHNTFKNLEIQTLVTSYDVFNGQAVVFNSRQDECETLPIWEVCRASAAAPVAFPSHLLTDKIFLNYWEKKQNLKLTLSPDNYQKCIPLVDGGVAANNPTLCAVAEAVKTQNNTSDLLVASFGCGKQKTKSISAKQSREWGPLEWINPLKDIPISETLSDGSSDVIDYISKQILSRNHYRFQPVFEREHSTFNANPDNLNIITEDTLKYIASKEIQAQLNNLAQQLTATPVAVSVEREQELVAVYNLN
ncbi:patatin-like phospholipase family protein [Capilliphycus salinus ALCB114379]|uniref:patatin-like phospholipase family protein n=1 Tax=Capilliphycus salinus TaxID=2768948 RepID=UPI0039A5E186